MAATAPFSSASSSHPPRLPSKTLTPRHSRPLHHRSPPAASAPRPLLLSLSAPVRRCGAALRASASQKISADYQFDEEDEEEEYEYDGEEEEDEDEEEMDVEAMEEEARGAAADLAKRLARELHIGEFLATRASSYLASYCYKNLQSEMLCPFFIRATVLCTSSFFSNPYNNYISDDDVREKRRNIRVKTSVSKHVSIQYIDVLLNEMPKC